MSKVTMQRLAEEAGVSRITVWKVLNDRPGVSEELRQLVRRKAEELGYGVPERSAPPAMGEPFPWRWPVRNRPYSG